MLSADNLESVILSLLIVVHNSTRHKVNITLYRSDVLRSRPYGTM